MKITSPAFANNLPLPPQYTCKGGNISPPLEFLEVPEQTKSLALIVEDTDSSSRNIHWLVYNIPGSVSFFDENEIPERALNGVNYAGTTGYEGPRPEYFGGIHHYCFKLYALDTLLDVPQGADSKQILQSMEGHILETADLSGLAEGELSAANK